MSKMSREEKLFKNENKVLEIYSDMLSQKHSADEVKTALGSLTHKYKSLLEQARFLTWISGRLERKLQRKNDELLINNARLQHTLDELTKAEAGKSVYAIIYSIAIALFVLEEFFVEPFIKIFDDSIGVSVLIKLCIVLLLKASEGLIEKRVTRPRRPPTMTKNVKSAVV
jgi:hypothetical protein